MVAQKKKTRETLSSDEVEIKEVIKATEARGELLEFWIGRWGSIIPMLFFVIWAVVMSLVLGQSTETSSKVPTYLILGIIIGLVVGMFLSKGSWKKYCQAIFDGMAKPVGVVAIICWLWAGMFAEVLKAGGLVEGLVWAGKLVGVSSSIFIGVTFVLAAVFASAVGTGYGTVIAFCRIMFPAGLILGAHPVLMLGAILSGAAFGDNLAPVSDTTIVSAVTQDADIPGVVRSRFKYAIAAAIPALILFLILGALMTTSGSSINLEDANKLVTKPIIADGLILLIPFALVIFLALRGNHIIVSITWGIIVASAFVILFKLGKPEEIFTLKWKSPELEELKGGALLRGVVGYLDLSVLILLIVAAGHIMQAGGALDAIKQWILDRAKTSVSRAEVAIWSLVTSLNLFITVNTAAEIAAAPIVKEVGESYKIHPYRRANFLDALTSALGYIFPWSGGVLVAISAVGELKGITPISHTEVWPYVLHGWFLVIVMLIAAITGFGRQFTNDK
ncbi:Na+/H+ antiporter NhaC family protein [candidate division KSB1 bacterium]|nr:Na+/H+ antiporter NhaC family protein [candidate division KSB1 bacterium]